MATISTQRCWSTSPGDSKMVTEEVFWPGAAHLSKSTTWTEAIAKANNSAWGSGRFDLDE